VLSVDYFLSNLESSCLTNVEDNVRLLNPSQRGIPVHEAGLVVHEAGEVARSTSAEHGKVPTRRPDSPTLLPRAAVYAAGGSVSFHTPILVLTITITVAVFAWLANLGHDANKRMDHRSGGRFRPPGTTPANHPSRYARRDELHPSRGQSLGVCTERVHAEAFVRGRLRTTPQVANAIHKSSSPKKIRS